MRKSRHFRDTRKYGVLEITSFIILNRVGFDVLTLFEHVY